MQINCATICVNTSRDYVVWALSGGGGSFGVFRVDVCIFCFLGEMAFNNNKNVRNSLTDITYVWALSTSILLWVFLRVVGLEDVPIIVYAFLFVRSGSVCSMHDFTCSQWVAHIRVYVTLFSSKQQNANTLRLKRTGILRTAVSALFLQAQPCMRLYFGGSYHFMFRN